MAINTRNVLMKNLSWQFIFEKFDTKKFSYVLVILGVVFPVFQYLSNRSLWLDEAYLVQSFTRDYAGLLKPLEADQVAPILFLWVVKFFSTLIPDSEYGLRLFPLFCYLASFYFFYQLVWLLIQNSYARLFAMTLFVFNSNLIYFASELKQFIVDVLVVTMTYYLLLRPYRNPIYRYYLLAFAGILAIGFSNVTPLILFSVGMYFIYQGIQQGDLQLKKLIPLFLLWLLAFAFYYINFIHDHPLKDFMIGYWSRKKAFMPLDVFSKEFLSFVIEKYKMIFKGLLTMGIISILPLSVLYLYGLVTVVRRKHIPIFVLLTFPLILHLILSGFEMYPFHLRLVLYFIPLVLLTLAFGIENILNFCAHNNFSKFSVFRNVFLLIPILWVMFGLKIFIKGFPIKKEEIKKSIRYIENNAAKTDQLFIHHSAWNAYNYYNYTGFVNHNLLTHIGSDSIDYEEYSKVFSKLKGRVWILFTRENEKKRIIMMLERNAKRLDEFTTFNSSAYLYDFSAK